MSVIRHKLIQFHADTLGQPTLENLIIGKTTHCLNSMSTFNKIKETKPSVPPDARQY